MIMFLITTLIIVFAAAVIISTKDDYESYAGEGKYEDNIKHDLKIKERQMGNMSYCRFQNTTSDFEECLEALRRGGFEELSSSEQKYCKRLIALAVEMTEEFGDITES